MFDLFRYPGGPRLRDRVSHGETDLGTLPRAAADQVLLLCAAVCACVLRADADIQAPPTGSSCDGRHLKSSVWGIHDYLHPGVADNTGFDMDVMLPSCITDSHTNHIEVSTRGTL